jgi:4-carboxymuconolactone decarboxylase
MGAGIGALPQARDIAPRGPGIQWTFVHIAIEGTPTMASDTNEDALQDLAKHFPDVATLMLQFAVGEIAARPGLGARERELAMVGALTALGHARPQLHAHIESALDAGCKAIEIVEVIVQMAVVAGFPAMQNALETVREVYTARGIRLPLRGEGAGA